jgi:diguanylate cyclase (GGDEF)-like protein
VALRRELRTEDLICRYGGEEFAIAVPAAAISEAVEAMGRVREALVQLSSRGDAPGFTASFGVSHSSEAADLDDLVQRADAALFAAKDAGRDGICLDGHDVPIAPRLTALS